MSHFASVETQISDLELLKKALARLEMGCESSKDNQPLRIKGWEKAFLQAEMEIKTGCSYSIGVVQRENGKYGLEADWWAIETYTGKTQKEIIDSVKREYAYVTVLDKVSTLGYSIVEEKVDSENQVKLVLRKWN